MIRLEPRLHGGERRLRCRELLCRPWLLVARSRQPCCGGFLLLLELRDGSLADQAGLAVAVDRLGQRLDLGLKILENLKVRFDFCRKLSGVLTTIFLELFL